MIVHLDYQNHSSPAPRPPAPSQANYAAHTKALWAPLPGTVPREALAAPLGPTSAGPLVIQGFPSPCPLPAVPTAPFCHFPGEGNQRT